MLISPEYKLIFKIVQNEYQWHVLEKLAFIDELPFTHLKKKPYYIDEPRLSNALRRLLDLNLIQKREIHSTECYYYRYYSLTQLGKKIFNIGENILRNISSPD